MRRGPLSRFKVIDLTRVRAGPTAVRQLADWGADVVKIEAPASVDTAKGMGGGRRSPDFQNLHRNKRGMTLNLKDPEGVAILKRMVERADVVVENYRPDVKHRLGIDYAALSAVNPRLVYASISGFGQDGPYARRPGFDQIAQGMGGLMSVTGLPGQGPVRAGIPVADLSSGLYCAIGILVALLEREETGKGRWVHSSLLQAMIAMMDFQAARWLMASEVPPQAGNNHPTSIPTGVFSTTDGHINVACSGDVMWERLCEVLEAPDLVAHPDYCNGEVRLKNRDALNEALQARFSHRSSAQWIQALNAKGVPCGPIYTMDQVFADPQVQHLGIAEPLDHPDLGATHVVGQAVVIDGAERAPFTATPGRGQHTDEVLAELGFSAEAIADLRARDVV
ncbi:MAG: CoA transferase [Ectothiorhodospiraceae bacterium]|nr:CoA transferase [Chromatiales bacterium]MCP5154519.1 CoA transferase [Ectothiorhodospiraceae bacterium]